MTIAILQRWIGARDAGHAGLMHVGAAVFALVMGVSVVMLMVNTSGAAVDSRVMRIAKAAAGGFSDDALRAATAQMDPAMVALARRYDPSLGQPGAPGLALPQFGHDPFGQAQIAATGLQAEQINAALAFSTDINPAARAFSLASASELDRERALECLTQAVYYEAAFEPTAGQQAVAQVVLNRLRHPAFPKSVCGVVYQGSERVTGCQFSFTCDGALARQPAAWAWERARKVAAAALNGHVMAAVGGATHYHATYVAPYWAPRLFKVSHIGAHVFYRWPGSWGLPGAFKGRYAGMERPGVDPGGDPNRIDLDTLRLAGVEGVAGQAQEATAVVAALTIADPTAGPKAEIIAEPEFAPQTRPEEDAKPVVVHVPPPRPKTPPRLAMPD
jgi:spore germination cell wall hydrolase CwlJ-like protein